jgi:hypothetical protein
MHLSTRSCVAALLFVAVTLPWREAVAADLHPLDPAAPPGVVPTQNAFEALIPLLDRESPVPSFIGEAPETTTKEGSTEDMPVGLTGADRGAIDQGTMDHSATGHGAAVTEEPE